MNPENTAPESESLPPAPRKRGRKPLPEGEAMTASVVVAMRPAEADRVKAWAMAQGLAVSSAVRALLLPLLGAMLLGLAVAGCAGTSLATVAASVKPVVALTCAGVDMVCNAAQAVCAYVEGDAPAPAPAPVSSGGEAPAPDAGPPDAGPDAG